MDVMNVTLRSDMHLWTLPQCGVSEGTLFSAITIKKRTSSGHHNVKTITIRQYNGRCNGDGQGPRRDRIRPFSSKHSSILRYGLLCSSDWACSGELNLRDISWDLEIFMIPPISMSSDDAPADAVGDGRGRWTWSPLQNFWLYPWLWTPLRVPNQRSHTKPG